MEHISKQVQKFKEAVIDNTLYLNYFKKININVKNIVEEVFHATPWDESTHGPINVSKSSSEKDD